MLVQRLHMRMWSTLSYPQALVEEDLLLTCRGMQQAQSTQVGSIPPQTLQGTTLQRQYE